MLHAILFPNESYTNSPTHSLNNIASSSILFLNTYPVNM